MCSGVQTETPPARRPGGVADYELVVTMAVVFLLGRLVDNRDLGGSKLSRAEANTMSINGYSARGARLRRWFNSLNAASARAERTLRV